MLIHCLVLSTLFISPCISLGQRISAGNPHVKETYLTGSEFEESFTTHLLNSSSLMAMTDDITVLLTTSNITYTLSSPDKPFEFVDRLYFWSEENFRKNADNDNTTVFSYICVFNASSDTGVFSQIYYPDGSPIEQVVFGCENSKECCGLKCCGDDVLINIIIVGAISVALLFLLLCNILIGFKKRRGDGGKGNEASAKYVVEPRGQEEMANGGEEIEASQVTLHTRQPPRMAETAT